MLLPRITFRRMYHRLSYWLMTMLSRRTEHATPGIPLESSEDYKLYLKVARDQVCPDCQHHGFLEGPHGGMSVNVYCANINCRSGFNVTPFGSGWGICQRIDVKGPIERYEQVTLH